MNKVIDDVKCLTPQQRVALVEAAEQTALRYCAPVYLVGSATWNMYPNDIDIYIAVQEQTYLRLFTNFGKASESESDHMKNMEDMKLQQARLYKKNKEYFEKRVKSWDFDVKFEHINQFLQHKGDRVRLDTLYMHLW
jgi:hypothetical protein